MACLPGLAAAEQVVDGQIPRLREAAVAYEHGQGVPRDGARAAALYCQAARLGDAPSAFDLGWMYANGRGVDRNDALAATFLGIAADQGITQARAVLSHLAEAPTGELPECLRPPPPVPAPLPDLPKASEAAPGTTRVAPEFVPARAPAKVVDIVKRLTSEYRVPPPLVWAVMEAESNFDSTAVSAKNAQGLMQLMPDTAARFNVANTFDPAQNIRGGIAYLRWLLAFFEGDVALVAAAYNAGERAVERHAGVPPYAETRAYVRRILSAVGVVTQPFDGSIVKPSLALPRIRDRQRAQR